MMALYLSTGRKDLWSFDDSTWSLALGTPRDFAPYTTCVPSAQYRDIVVTWWFATPLQCSWVVNGTCRFEEVLAT
jgi:hypothetical protein